MRGFMIAIGLLALNLFGCGAAFIAGQTGLVIPLFLTFFLLYGWAAFRAGRGVEFHAPISPRGTARNAQRARRLADDLRLN